MAAIPTIVRRAAQILVIVLSSILSTGAQWEFLQLVAWGRMFAANTQTMSLRDAAAKTFDGEMCEMCRAIANAKEQERKESEQAPAPVRKLVLFCQESAVRVLPVRLAAREQPTAEVCRGGLLQEPPTPPPRLA